MKSSSLIFMFAFLLPTATGHTETVYKLKDSSGATVYSDRPELQGTTNAGTVKLAPGPSSEEQKAAKQKVQKMEAKSEEMRRSRLDKEQQREEAQVKSNAVVEERESSGVGVVDDHLRRDPKARIPVESPGGGEHPIYEPREGRHVPITPRPSPRAGR